MKRASFISLFLAFFLFIQGCSLKGREQDGKYADSVFGESSSSEKIILFFPDKEFEYLLPEERQVKIKTSVEKTVLEELIKGPASIKEGQFILKKTDINSAYKNNGKVTVNLSNKFFSGKKVISKSDEMVLYSIVDSLTMIPGINQVMFKTSNKIRRAFGENKLLNRPAARNRKIFNKNYELNPSEVLGLQMAYEQQGKWLYAYTLMSDDENDIYRKSYNDYVSEMEEVSFNGYTSQKFKVGDYSIDKMGNKASVKVTFYIKESGDNEKAENFYFNCVRIDNIWMVDWLTTQ